METTKAVSPTRNKPKEWKENLPVLGAERIWPPYSFLLQLPSVALSRPSNLLYSTLVLVLRPLKPGRAIGFEHLDGDAIENFLRD